MRFIGSCWQIAPSSSGHNEPIRLYFYFRHAAYRAIPSLRGGYRDAAAPCTYMYALLDTRARRYMYGHIRTKIPARNTKSVYVASRRDARRGTARHGTARHARPLFAGPILRCPRGPLTLMLTPMLPPLLPFGLYRERVRTCVCARIS